MSDEHIKPHPAIRTFAQDLAAAREKRGQSSSEGSSATTPTTPKEAPEVPRPADKAQAPSATVHVAPKIPTPSIPKPEPIPAPTKTSTSPTPQTQTHIPAFHELQKKVNSIKTNQSKEAEKTAGPKPDRTKIAVNSSSTPKSNTVGYDATIITDTKHNTFNPFTAIGTSLRAWFTALTKSKKKKAPVYTVPDTERRKGVIQKATSKSGSLFTADSAELKAKIKQRQKLAEAAQEQQSKEEKEVTWSPYTDAGYNLLESPEEKKPVTTPHNVAVEFKKHTQPTPKVEVPAPAPEPIAQPVPPPPTPVEPVVKEEPTHTAPVEPVPEPTPVEPKKKVEDNVAPIEKEQVPAAHAPEPTPAPATSNEPAFSLTALNTNTLAMSIVASLAAVVVIFFVAKALIGYVMTTEPLVVNDTTTYLKSAQPNPVVVSQVTSITDIPLQAGTLLDISYVDTQLLQTDGSIVPPATLIQALGLRLIPSFAQSLTDVRFAQLNNSAPILVFEFTNADTALGGFLAWEDHMVADLREVYLITESGAVLYTDQSVDGQDVRILQSNTGETLLVYGIVNDNTALITRSIDTFYQVLNTSFTK